MERKNQDFPSTLSFGRSGFEETQMLLPKEGRRHGCAHSEKGTKLAQTACEDRSMWIIVGTCSVLALAAVLPQFRFFQEWTDITGWIPFLRSVTESTFMVNLLHGFSLGR